MTTNINTTFESSGTKTSSGRKVFENSSVTSSKKPLWNTLIYSLILLIACIVCLLIGFYGHMMYHKYKRNRRKSLNIDSTRHDISHTQDVKDSGRETESFLTPRLTVKRQGSKSNKPRKKVKREEKKVKDEEKMDKEQKKEADVKMVKESNGKDLLTLKALDEMKGASNKSLTNLLQKMAESKQNKNTLESLLQEPKSSSSWEDEVVIPIS